MKIYNIIELFDNFIWHGFESKRQHSHSHSHSHSHLHAHYSHLHRLVCSAFALLCLTFSSIRSMWGVYQPMCEYVLLFLFLTLSLCLYLYLRPLPCSCFFLCLCLRLCLCVLEWVTLQEAEKIDPMYTIIGFLGLFQQFFALGPNFYAEFCPPKIH